MNQGPRSHRRTGRVFQSLAVTAAVLALGATACSSGSPKASGTTKVAPNAKLASAALSAGLKAYAAGDLTGAAADYNKTLKYDATNKYAFYNLALIDASNSNYGLAEGHYRSALASDAKFDPALFNLAILRTSSDPKEAISLYQRAVSSDKTDAAAWLNLGLLLRSNGQAQIGDKDVLKAIALDPKLTDPAKATGTTVPTTPTTTP
jgi:tetratricopeptide (TPR) repeat protein